MISNQSKFPGAKFLSDDEIRVIGNVGESPFVIVGYDAEGRLLVSHQEGDDYFALTLRELLNHSQYPISIKNSD